jgi:hypothetical protein
VQCAPQGISGVFTPQTGDMRLEDSFTVSVSGIVDVVASLGAFAFGPLSRPRKNYPVEVTLAYDAEGLVRATARDPLTGEVIARDLASEERPDLLRIRRSRELLDSVII